MVTDMDERGLSKDEAKFPNGEVITVLDAVLNGILPGESENLIMNAMLTTSKRA